MNLKRMELGCYGCGKSFKLDRKQFVFPIGDLEVRGNGVKIFKVKFKCDVCGKIGVYCLSEEFMQKVGIFNWKSV